MEKTARKNGVGRIIGLVVFAVGALMLVFVFFRAYYLFTSPPSRVAPTTMTLTEAGLTLAAQIGLLFIMTLAGSLIAARGVQLYLGCPER